MDEPLSEEVERRLSGWAERIDHLTALVPAPVPVALPQVAMPGIARRAMKERQAGFRLSGCRRLARAAVLLACMAAVSGCERVTQEGDATVYHYGIALPLLVFAGGILAFLIGFALLRTGRLVRIGLVFLVLGPLMCVVMAPEMLFGDRITVSKEGFSMRTGFWWKPTVHEVRFAELSKIEVKERRSRGVDKEYDLVCLPKRGHYQVVPVSDLMKLGAEAQILQTARELGIEVVEKH